MTTGLFYHHDCLLHDMGDDHPEAPGRLAAIVEYLEDIGLGQDLSWITPQEVSHDLLRLAHSETYLEQLQLMAPARGRIMADPDTAMTPHTLRAARLAAGGCSDAVDAVLSGELSNAFVCARPPGHHAERSKTMGFCFYNNVAIAAKRALHFHNLERVAIFDFDVHQGNGTIDILRTDPRVLVCSTFQHPFYPNSPLANLPPNILNVPLPDGTTGLEYRRAVEANCLKPLQDFKPQLVLVSAGFDGHRKDPLAGFELETDDYRWITELLCSVARDSAGGRLVSTLEGGYHLGSLAQSAGIHVAVLTENQ